MPWMWKAKPARPRVSHKGPFTITREDRAVMPDRIIKITMKHPNPFNHGRVTIYEAPASCPKCGTLLVNERCPGATGRRKLCQTP
jgi:hypothetical protein